MKMKQNIIQNGHIFQIIQTEYLLKDALEQENALCDLKDYQPDIHKIYSHAKDPYEAKCQY